MSRRPLAVALTLPAVVATVLATGACTASSTSTTAPAAATPTPAAVPTSSSAPSPSAPVSSAPPSPAAPNPAVATGKYVFPLIGKSGYGHTHHGYPATDIIADCGLTAVSPVDGTVLEVTRVDTWTKKVNAGATRGGLSVSILGADGVRYYLSHFSSIDAGVDAHGRVTAGQPIAKVGRTGDAGACHIHFGLSPVCAKTGDWWIRRGVLYPWPYLDAWHAHQATSPAAEIAAWQATNGCPTTPTVEP
jgi:murein DD-endopeptidase MepM/ murein hydrolase activator NlpD